MKLLASAIGRERNESAGNKGEVVEAANGSLKLRFSMPELPPPALLTALGFYNLLPAIVFLPTRRRCDEAASEAAFTRRNHSPERREARLEFMQQFVRDYPEVKGHRHWDTIINGAVASHHAGHIPAWKLVIEKLMSQGLLDAIFATNTVAAGVDFPARTVVLTGADTRTASGWRALTASEVQQMTGRAGRRGRDRVGFIIAAPGPHQDPQKIAALLKAPPDPLVSQFRATYSTLLNLLDAYGSFSEVRAITEKSFAYRDAARSIAQLETEIGHRESEIQTKLQEAGCNLPVSQALGFERLVSARTRLQESKPQTRTEALLSWLDEVTQPGRIVGLGRAGRRLVMVTERWDGNASGVREDGRRSTFPLSRVGRVYSPFYSLRDADLEDAFEEIRFRGKELTIAEPRLRHLRAADEDALGLLNDVIEGFLPSRMRSQEYQRCTKALWALLSDAEAIATANQRIDQIRLDVWQPFEQLARVLDTFGYLDISTEKVTTRGPWLADLHIDRPLIVGEALERGSLAAVDSTRMAAVIAALTADEDRTYGEIELEDNLISALSDFEAIGYQIATEEWKQGVSPAAELNFSAAGAASHWASGTSWTSLVRQTRAEEGDLFRMLSRTGEALLQIASLRDAHPHAARTASIAASAVLREPIR